MAFLAALLSNKLKLPYTLVLVLAGVSITIIAFLFASQGGSDFSSQLRLIYAQLLSGGGGGLFVGLVVPPLIFEAMIHLRASDLKAVIKPSLALATIGVLITTAVGGLILWKLVGLSPDVSFLFAALIAPTDTVTVLEVFRRVKVPSKLSTLLDTEAAFNDATGIVLFTLILSSIGLGLQDFSLPQTLLSFGFTLGAGVLIGLVVAFIGEVLSSLIKDRVAETILAIAVVYGSYALASGIGASGLIAVAVAGLYFGNYTMRSAMEPSSREAVTSFWAIAAFLGNSVAFLLIGFQTNIITLSQSILLIVAAFAAVTIARAATVYPILRAFDKFGNKISAIWCNIAMLGGVKGALSIALAATITTSAVISSGDIQNINTMVLGVAFISIVFQVPLLFRYIKKKMPQTQIASEIVIDEQFELMASHIDELKKLKANGEISNEEFIESIEEGKRRLDDLIAKSPVTIETRKIIRARASGLYASFPKIPKRKVKSKSKEEKNYS
ncbi:MAG TPA: cation:proton antiporter [Candidatus Bathyarchaeia archaeon]